MIKVFFSDFKQHNKTPKPTPFFQGPACWVPPTSWLIWVPVGSPCYLSDGDILTVHQLASWSSSLCRVHACTSPLPGGRLPLFLMQRATTFMKGIPRSALWPSGPSLDLASLSPKQAETNKERAVEVPGLHSVVSWRTATGHLTFPLLHHLTERSPLPRQPLCHCQKTRVKLTPH